MTTTRPKTKPTTIPRLPTIRDEPGTDSVTLVVFAPFGTDPVLSGYPDGTSLTLEEHPMYIACGKVCEQGVHVVALIDRQGDESRLVDFSANDPHNPTVHSLWKQDMSAPETLSSLLRHAHRRHPLSALVLAVEGHGAGFLPDLDQSHVTNQTVTEHGRFEWQIAAKLSVPVKGGGDDIPVLPAGIPVLPAGIPVLPGAMPISTYELGLALKMAVDDGGVPKLACIHFNNCFNMALEVLDTVAPYAKVAAGYMNYNFFTAGQAYPPVFRKLANAGGATAARLADWFVKGNQSFLKAGGHHPTTAGVIELSRMRGIVDLLDTLCAALLDALQQTGAADRAANVDKILEAIKRAQQYDSDGNFLLETPDELTDLCSLAHELQQDDFGPYPVKAAAAALEAALANIKQYGDDASPWMAPQYKWDFSQKDLAMNIFLPDPLRIGKWDWRSPYYLDVSIEPDKDAVQRKVIGFLLHSKWVPFLIEYHKDVAFVGFLAARLPSFPHFKRSPGTTGKAEPRGLRRR